MEHVVYLDRKARELENLAEGSKTMLIRGAMGRKLPYGRVNEGDVLYFMENNGDGWVKAKAVVSDVFQSEKLTPEQSLALVEENQDKLLLDAGMKKRFAGKRYLVLISVKDFEEIPFFQIDRSAYGNMDDWLPVEEIEQVRIKD